MTFNHTEVPAFPQVKALVRTNGTGEVIIAGNSRPIEGTDETELRRQALDIVTSQADVLGRPVRVRTEGPEGIGELIVSPGGSIEEVHAETAGSRRRRTGTASTQGTAFAVADQPVAIGTTPPREPEPLNTIEPHPAMAPVQADEPPAVARNGQEELPTLNDFLATRPAPPAGPAQQGWQGAVRKVSFGLIRPTPGVAETRHRDAVAAVQRSLSGPRTIVVVNPKGGAHKTTATLLIAATFGIYRGGYTLAWDNNETRGTLGWRATQARHSNTALNLLTDLDRFDDPTRSRVGDLDNYVRSQGSTQFDVLASDEDAASAALIGEDEFNSLHHALSRFYRIIVVDTGNNMRASNWEASVAAADQLVIISTVREDTAASAVWLTDGLREKGHETKVRNAVTLLAAPAQRPDEQLSRRVHGHFGKLTRTVLDVPYDPALVSGGPLNYAALQQGTREAWLHASAAIADGL